MAKKPLARAMELMRKRIASHPSRLFVLRKDLNPYWHLYEVKLPGPLFCALGLYHSSKYYGFTLEVNLGLNEEALHEGSPKVAPHARYRLGSIMSQDLRHSCPALPEDRGEANNLSNMGDFWWMLLGRYCFLDSPDSLALANSRVEPLVDHAMLCIEQAALPWFAKWQEAGRLPMHDDVYER